MTFDDPHDDITDTGDLFAATSFGLFMESMTSKLVISARLLNPTFNEKCAHDVASYLVPDAS